MGFIKKAANKQADKAKAAAKNKAKKVGRSITPGLCNATGGRHRYGRTVITTHDAKGRPFKNVIVSCACGKMP
jgi:hypothetical protein